MKKANLSQTRAKPPIFIAGFQRSGTTLTRLMLNSHPNIAVPFETGFFADYYRRRESYGDLSQPENARAALRDIARERPSELGALVGAETPILESRPSNMSQLLDGIMRHYAIRHGKVRWGDKSPAHNNDLDILWTMFPDARFVHIVRDGRDVALSHKTVSWGSRNLPKVAREWSATTVLCDKIGALLGPSQYLCIHFEDLVRKSEETLRRICAFVDEPYSPRMLDYHVDAKEKMPKQSLVWHQSSVARLDEKKCLAWKGRMPISDRVIFEEIAGDALAHFGYESETTATSFATKCRKLYYAVVARY